MEFAQEYCRRQGEIKCFQKQMFYELCTGMIVSFVVDEQLQDF